MDSLEKRFYSRNELAEIAGLDTRDHNFAAKMKNTLTLWGYEYEFKTHRGFVITKVPETPEEQLKEILIRFFGIDSQVNTIDFACFITAFHIIEGYESMPWDMREKLYYEYFGRSVCKETLWHWCRKLCEKRTMYIDVSSFSPSARLWHTCRKAGRKIQEPADPESPKYKEYCVKRSELLKNFEEMGMNSREKWATMIRLLFNEYGVYYKCKYIDLPAFGPKVQEITDLTYEIMINT